MARLVLTHSTFIPTLLNLLKKLSISDKISTIVPGRLYRVSSNHIGPLELRLTTNLCTVKSMNESVNARQKLLVRFKSIAQEVFLSFDSQNQLTTADLGSHLRSLLCKENVKIGTCEFVNHSMYIYAYCHV